MGQTLTHRVYLPDEGERNCYNGLAANWQLLDTSVGTIAEHTSALSGKAPLVHTHTKSDITDFPVYGNAAGTICEGNDSRLSDARTPVAHTHTKSDVTDLLNSNFIPSANNSYDLGSSSYQWNNLYAKNYYYNGVAWGLDKANVWTQNNRIQAFLEIQYIASGGYSDIRWFDENNVNCCTFRQSANFLTIGKKYTSKSSWYDGAQILITASGAVIFKGYDGANTQSAAFTYDSFYPEQNNAINLGTSTNKWKTLNGINPGALSIPSGIRQSILEYITDVNLGWGNQITAARDGYIVVTINDAAGNSIYLFNDTRRYSNGSCGNGSQGTGRLTCMLPVNEGDKIIIFIKAAALSDVFSAYLYVMNGNVNALPSS